MWCRTTKQLRTGCSKSSELSLKELRSRAMDDGADAVILEELLHNDDPKEATIAFCVERELSKAREAAADDDEVVLPAKPWLTEEQQLLEQAWQEYIREDEQYSWDVADGNASDSEWQNHRDSRWSSIAEKLPDRTAKKSRHVKLIGKNHIINPPGMHTVKSLACFTTVATVARLRAKNLVPSDSMLNPSSTDLI